MATIRKFGPWAHLRAEPNQIILQYSSGKLKRSGPGLAFWFWPLSAAVAQLPSEDYASTFVLNERSADFQAVAVQLTVTYRVADAQRAASRVNFSLSLESGAWTDKPLDKLAAFWGQRVLQPARSYLARTPLETALREGSERIREAVTQAMASDGEIAALGLAPVGVVIDNIAPSADMEKALQTPTREAIQTKADEAQFQRRALAVEKERAIKENELATEIELERKQEVLIRQRGDNALLQVKQENASAQERSVAEAERQRIGAEASAQRTRIESKAAIEAQRAHADAVLDEERSRHAIWEKTPGPVLSALVLQRLASTIQSIGHLNVTPELLAQSFTQLLRDNAGDAPKK